MKLIVGQIELELHVQHLADPDTLEQHRRAHIQAPHRPVEVEQETLLVKIDLLVGLVATGIEGKPELCGCRLAAIQRRRGIEGNPTDQHRQQRLGVYTQAVGVQLEIDPARVPEAGVGQDQAVIRCGDEELDTDRRPILVQLVTDHLSHPDMPVVHR